MRALHVGVDVDDVIFPWYHLAHEASERAGITNGASPKSWQPYEEYGCPQQAWFDALEVATLDGSLYRGDLYPGAVEALQRLKDAGHFVHIVTARGFFNHGHLIREATINTLKDVPHDSLTFTKDKTIMRVDAFVDDAVHNVQALVAAGVPTWMVNQPHNEGFDYPHRVDHICGFVDAVMAADWESVA